jgi:hypothetical protein
MKNIILVTGTSAEVNFLLTEKLQNTFIRYGIPQAFNAIYDCPFLPTAIESYRQFRKESEVSVAGLEVSHNTYALFFDHLTSVRDAGPVVMANLTVGPNDSYKHFVTGLMLHEFSDGWTQHLIMAIHAVSDGAARAEPNGFEIFQTYLELWGVPRSSIETVQGTGDLNFFERAMVLLEGQGIGHLESRKKENL